MSAHPWVRQAMSKCKGEDLARVWLEEGRQFATDGHRLHVLDRGHGQAGLVVMEPPCAEQPPPLPPPIDLVVPKGRGVLFSTRALRSAVAEAYKGFGCRDRVAPVYLAIEAHVLRVYGSVAGDYIPDAKTGKVPRVVRERLYHPAVQRPEPIAVIPAVTIEDFACKGKIELNARYVLDALALPTPSLGTGRSPFVWLHATSPRDAVKFTHEDGRIAVIMPRR